MLRKSILISVSIILILSIIGLSSCSSPSAPSTPVAPQATLMDRIAAAEARLTSVENVANNANTKAASSISQSDLSSLKSDISQLKTDIATLKTQVGSSDIASLKTQVSDLNTKVADLNTKLTAHLVVAPTPTSTSGSGTGANATVKDDLVTITIKDLGTLITAGNPSFDSDGTIKLSVTNLNTTSISNLRMLVHLLPDSNIAKSLIDVPMGLGGDISAISTTASPDEFIFKTGKLTIAAGKTKTFYLSPTITLLPKAYYRYVSPDLVYSDNSTAPNKINAAYLSDDIAFEETVEIIDYNID
jgi:hypothetical protein